MESLRLTFFSLADSLKLFVLSLLFSIPVVTFFLYLYDITDNADWNIWAVNVGILAGHLMVFEYVRRRQDFDWKSIIVNNKESISIILVLILGLALAIGTNIIAIEMGNAFSAQNIPDQEAVNATGITTVIGNGLFTVFILPFTEEVMFRGIILKRIECFFESKNKVHGAYWAVALSSIFFAILHGSIHQVVTAFIGSIIFGWLVLKTGTVVYGAICHIINNALVYNQSLLIDRLNYLGLNWRMLFLLVAVAVVCICISIISGKMKDTIQLIGMYVQNIKRFIKDSQLMRSPIKLLVLVRKIISSALLRNY